MAHEGSTQEDARGSTRRTLFIGALALLAILAMGAGIGLAGMRGAPAPQVKAPWHPSLNGVAAEASKRAEAQAAHESEAPADTAEADEARGESRAEGEGEGADRAIVPGPQGYTPYSSGEVNILLLGSDSRTTKGDVAAWSPDDARSDVMMLVQVSADRRHASVMSFTRNLATDIPGYSDGPTLINTAYAHGGVPLAVQTVQELTGIRIDHTIVSDFLSFQRLVYDLGGITLTSQAEGTRVYDGREALRWARERKSLPNDDLDRIRRHQAFLRAFHEQFLTPEGAAVHGGYAHIYELVAGRFLLDGGLNETVALDLATALASMNVNDIAYVSFPYADTVRDMYGFYIRNIDWAKAAPLMQAFREGNSWAYVASHSLETLDCRPVE